MTEQPLPFEPRYRTRTGDPVTSLEAAESVTRITAKQNAVLDVLQTYGPSTDVDLNSAYNYQVARGRQPRQSDSGLRARRSELVTRKLVRDSGVKEVLESGRRAIVWEALV
jgi:hypothetical protein